MPLTQPIRRVVGPIRRGVNRRRAARLEASLSPVAHRMYEERLTYLPHRSLRNVERCVRTVDRENVDGIMLEAGIALGGSAIVIATLMPADRRFRGYDVFGMIPAPGERDDEKSHARYDTIASGASTGIRGDHYYGYEDDLYSQVVGRFEVHGLPIDGDRIALRQGLFEDTLRLDADAQVALAHLDCDWYDSVSVCLDSIYPRLSPGGFIISDDYHNYGGCTEAVDEFLDAHPDVVKVDDGSGPPERSTNLIMRRRSP